MFKSTNRIFVGSPLCQDEGYIRSSAAFANWLGVGAIVVGQFLPSILKPFLGYLTAVPIYIQKKKSFGYLIPVFKERMKNLRGKRGDPNFVFEKPKDMITWMTNAVLDNPGTSSSKPEALAERILFFVSSTRFYSDFASPASSASPFTCISSPTVDKNVIEWEGRQVRS